MLPEANQPYQLPRRKPVLTVTPANNKNGKAEHGDPVDDARNAMIHRALKALMGNSLPEGETLQIMTERLADEGVMFIDLPDLEGAIDALRAAGLDVKGESSSAKTSDKNSRKKKSTGDEADEAEVRDEL